MRFSSTRKAVKEVRNGTLKDDIDTLIAGIEKMTRKKNAEIAGARIDELIGIVIGLRKTLPIKTRLAVLKAIFADATKADVPHQWERKEGFECGDKSDCGKENPDKTCFRDTKTQACTSL
jgi:hypothetical protein